ncbi:hypothetical protein Pmani_015933 [Petrolisthes manimaculis]|uniref:Uncharacterized protein n=1 Tax=Petrolisthes manimaculis TaxID=1843537 RepID=A0AAE1PQ31_9EUCA|nr:hypothetical protein Pmani_015933 [Petrolisthes manimaculis]
MSQAACRHKGQGAAPVRDSQCLGAGRYLLHTQSRPSHTLHYPHSPHPALLYPSLAPPLLTQPCPALPYPGLAPPLLTQPCPSPTHPALPLPYSPSLAPALPCLAPPRPASLTSFCFTKNGKR